MQSREVGEATLTFLGLKSQIISGGGHITFPHCLPEHSQDLRQLLPLEQCPGWAGTELSEISQGSDGPRGSLPAQDILSFFENHPCTIITCLGLSLRCVSLCLPQRPSGTFEEQTAQGKWKDKGKEQSNYPQPAQGTKGRQGHGTGGTEGTFLTQCDKEMEGG